MKLKTVFTKIRKAFEPRVYVLLKNEKDFYDIKMCKQSYAQTNDLHIFGRKRSEAEDNYIGLMLELRDKANSDSERMYYIYCLRWFFLHYYGIHLNNDLKEENT